MQLPPALPGGHATLPRRLAAGLRAARGASGGVLAAGRPRLGLVDTRRASVLHARNLRVTFTRKSSGLLRPAPPPLVAVDGVNLEIGAGESVGLVGESGCGKSTLSRALMQLVRPQSGEVLLDGVDLCRLGERELRPYRRRVQMVFQDPFSSLNPRLTVG